MNSDVVAFHEFVQRLLANLVCQETEKAHVAYPS
jgi:hypothetical protein